MYNVPRGFNLASTGPAVLFLSPPIFLLYSINKPILISGIGVAGKAQTYSFEAANVRHENEWRLRQGAKLPVGKPSTPSMAADRWRRMENACAPSRHPQNAPPRFSDNQGSHSGEHEVAHGDDIYWATSRFVVSTIKSKISVATRPHLVQKPGVDPTCDPGRNPDRLGRTAVIIRDGLCPHAIVPVRRHSLCRYSDDRRRPPYSGIGNREQQHYDAERVFGLDIGVGDPKPSPVVLRGDISIPRRRICGQHA
jgi:hypothetical protein